MFALLGHNGAGKTTALSVITGDIPADSGDVYIQGLSVRTQLGAVRRQIGVCPQHDLLWEQLTAREHLRLFGRLRWVGG